MEKASLKGKENIFSRRLAELINKKGINQDVLAEKLGVKRQTISLYVTGQSLPPLEKFIEIANFFTVSTDYLLGISDAPTSKEEIRTTSDYTGLSVDSIKLLNFFYNDDDYTRKSLLDHINAMICLGLPFFISIDDYMENFLESIYMEHIYPDIDFSIEKMIPVDYLMKYDEKCERKPEEVIQLRKEYYDKKKEEQPWLKFKIINELNKFLENYEQKKTQYFDMDKYLKDCDERRKALEETKRQIEQSLEKLKIFKQEGEGENDADD